MSEYYPPARRSSSDMLERELEIINHSTVIQILMQSLSSILAIADENRHILTVNNEFLTSLKIPDPRNVFGMRPGEALECKHSHENPEGCGHSAHCSSCGLALSIVLSDTFDKPQEKTCALEIDQEGVRQELAFQVKCSPLKVENKKYYLLFLQDITKQQYWVNMEKIFLHDLNNILTAMMGISDLLQLTNIDHRKIYQDMELMIKRLRQEVDIQRCMAGGKDPSLQLHLSEIFIPDFIGQLVSILSHHPDFINKKIIVGHVPDVKMESDFSILMRILNNMLTNALEACSEGEAVKIEVGVENDIVKFDVWNPGYIPEDIQLRIFQKHFSSKASMGRGLGTFSMKLLGEGVLGGKITFHSEKDTGTTFSLSLQNCSIPD